MDRLHADAFVFFGASGDLAYKKIFPALQAMARRGKLDFPVVGVAKSGWTLAQRGFVRLGRKKWTRHVHDVVELLKAGLQADDVVLGGGQTNKLEALPAGVRTSDNLCAIRGGRRLWDATDPRRRRTLVTRANRF